MDGRVILRYSIDGEKNSALRNTINKKLEAAGFERTQTGTLELGVGDPADIPLLIIQEALAMLMDPQAAGVETPGSLDHLWLYIDKGI